MYNLKYRSGLLYADILIVYNGKEIVIPEVIIDTGACQSIILTEYLFDLGAGFEDDDEIVVLSGIGGAEASAVRKKIGKVSIGSIEVSDLEIDFGTIDPNDRINGLIGMDFLKKSKSVININRITLSEDIADS